MGYDHNIPYGAFWDLYGPDLRLTDASEQRQHRQRHLAAAPPCRALEVLAQGRRGSLEDLYSSEPPKVALSMAFWSLFNGIWGVVKASWGAEVLALSTHMPV